MPVISSTIHSPVIAPFGETLVGSQSRISSDIYITIETKSRHGKIYFTTDGTDPDIVHRQVNGIERTFKYRGPFKLRPGKRTVKAVVVYRRSHEKSHVSTRTFLVDDANISTDMTDADECSTTISTVSIPESDPDTYVTDPYKYPDLSRQVEPHSYAAEYRQSLRDEELDSFFRSRPRRPRLYEGVSALDSYDNEPTTDDYSGDVEVSNYFLRQARQPRHHSPTRVDTHSRTMAGDMYYRRRSPDITESIHRDRENRDLYEPPYDERSRIYDRSPQVYDRSPQVRFAGGDHRNWRSMDQALYEEERYQYNPRPYNSLSHLSHERNLRADRPKSPREEAGYRRRHTLQTGRRSFEVRDDPIAYSHTAGHNSDMDINDRVRLKENYDPDLAYQSDTPRYGRRGRGSRPPRKDDHPITKDGKKDVSQLLGKYNRKQPDDKDLVSKYDQKKSSQRRDRERSSPLSDDTPTVKEPVSVFGKNVVEKKPTPPEVAQTSSELGGTQARTLQSSNGAMSFINDSGTQINFWGMKPDAALDHIKTALSQSAPGGAVRDMPGGITRDMLKSALQTPTIHALPAPETQSGLPPSASHVTPVVTETKQHEQQGIVSFFRRIFGKSEKDAEKPDPRSTVREVEGYDGDKLSFEQIKEQCLTEGRLWEDPEFPAEENSLYFKQKPAVWPIEWKRPQEICQNPQMFVGGASRFDVKQGILGNCWLLAGVACVTTNSKLFKQVVPTGQSFQNDYAGVFRVRLWQYGRWVEVCIDDRLPTYKGNLIYMHSIDGNEFWSPLLEKAYAKINGSYEALTGGLTSEALTDFTGGICERFNFKEELPSTMFQILLKARERGSLMGCSIDATADTMEEQLENGLIIGHAYSITDVKLVDSDNDAVELLRIRNPWGNDCEWKGAWSDGSDEWKSMSDETKKSLGLNFDHDGEFWMSYKDFSTHFHRVEICHVNPDLMSEDSGTVNKWTSKLVDGSWKKKVNCGGCRNYPASFWTNPQYRVAVTDVDEDDEEEIGTVIVGLMQKNRRKLKNSGEDNVTIGYEIYKIEEDQGKTLDKDFFSRYRPVASSSQYVNMREICGRHRLPPSEYCIIPTTFEPDTQSDFILRIYTEKDSDIVELDEETGIVEAKNDWLVRSAGNLNLSSEAEEQVRTHGGEDGEIDAFELRDILNSVFTKDFDFGGFDVNLCRSMVAMCNSDRLGYLNVEEFKQLWESLQTWKTIYKQFDKDQSGHFNSYELREALRSLGFQVSNDTFNALVLRFSDKDGFVKFDDFVACLTKLKTMYDSFSCGVKGQDKVASYTLDEFMQMTMYS